MGRCVTVASISRHLRTKRTEKRRLSIWIGNRTTGAEEWDSHAARPAGICLTVQNGAFFCGQRFIQDERVAEYNDPGEEIRMDCFSCGGQGTMIGHRAKSNGHFHASCVACGCSVIE